MRSQSETNNAPGCNSRQVTLTHPCHPLHGVQGEFIQGPKTRSEAVVLVQLARGELRQFPKSWTSLAPLDPYRLLATPPLLRLESLLEIADWIAARRRTQTEKGPAHLPGGRTTRRFTKTSASS